MAIYVVLFVMANIFISFEESETISKWTKRAVVCGVMGLLLFLTFALRHPSMGIDLHYGSSSGYLASYKKIAEMSWEEVLAMESYLNYERGYVIFNKVVSTLFGSDYQILLIACAFCSIAPMVYVIYKKSESPAFSFILYMSLPFFLLIFSGLRQSIAIGLCFLAFSFVEEKKLIPFLLWTALAYTFHSSAILFFVVYPAYHIKFSSGWRWASAIALPLLYINAEEIFGLLNTLFSLGVTLDPTDAIELFTVYTLIYAFCIFFQKDGGVRKKGFQNMLLAKDEESGRQQGYLNMFWIACACQAMSAGYSLASRMGFYYSAALLFLLPSVITHMPLKNVDGSFAYSIHIKKPHALPAPDYLTATPVADLYNTRVLGSLKRFLFSLPHRAPLKYVLKSRLVKRTVSVFQEDLRDILLLFIVGCFMVFGLINLMTSFFAMAYPYKFFWKV